MKASPSLRIHKAYRSHQKEKRTLGSEMDDHTGSKERYLQPLSRSDRFKDVLALEKVAVIVHVFLPIRSVIS